jgi:ribonuclease HI
MNEILIQASHIQSAGKSVMFCWVPGHTGLPGNEAAEDVAKVAT